MIERMYSNSHANTLWQEVIDQENLTVAYNDININNYSTRECYLSNKNMIVSGAGKGVGAASINTSACFEALEYYLSGIHHRNYPYTRATIAEIAQQYKTLPYRCEFDNFINATDKKTQLPWAIYTDITTNEEFAVPLATVDLTYFGNQFEYDPIAYPSYNFYAASNGLASGCSFEEAVTHGFKDYRINTPIRTC